MFEVKRRELFRGIEIEFAERGKIWIDYRVNRKGKVKFVKLGFFKALSFLLIHVQRGTKYIHTCICIFI